jgi:hypothetical protein
MQFSPELTKYIHTVIIHFKIFKNWDLLLFVSPINIHNLKKLLSMTKFHLGVGCLLLDHVLFHYYYEMWVEFTSSRSLGQWIHCIIVRSRSLEPINSLKISVKSLSIHEHLFIVMFTKVW